MLNYLRKNTKFIAWFIVISFGVWGAASFVMSGFTDSSNWAGKAFGKKISNTDFNRSVKIVQIFSDNPGENPTEEELEARAWQHIALVMKARKAGLRVSDREVEQEVIKHWSREGSYNENFYKQWVRNVFREEPRAFEEKVRDCLMAAKLLSQFPDEASRNQLIRQIMAEANITSKEGS
ncbi:MAG: SurA N-terminal domain-containing protein [Candidatus Omnitrophica bacterium]|nr:SurA N-terminal domain-containing protein [Candidatus Omnitrophota bacterium]